jgi:hypothetical protein
MSETQQRLEIWRLRFNHFSMTVLLNDIYIAGPKLGCPDTVELLAAWSFSEELLQRATIAGKREEEQ